MKPTYQKQIKLNNEQLKSLNFDDISRIVDKIIRPEDDDGFIIKRFGVPSNMTVIDLDFKGRK